MAEVAGICGTDDGTELGTGWGRLHDAWIPWTIKYDEVLTVFEGELRLHADGVVHELQARDCIWLPKGTELIYEAKSALIHFAIHPANWSTERERSRQIQHFPVNDNGNGWSRILPPRTPKPALSGST